MKLQVEFNPATVAEYRLVGYETRALKREDFNNDAVDAGDVGSGHTVTAIYEITPVGSDARMVDQSRYAKNDEAAGSARHRQRIRLPQDPLQTTRQRAQSQLIEQPIPHRRRSDVPQTCSATCSSRPRWRASRSCCAAARTPAR